MHRSSFLRIHLGLLAIVRTYCCLLIHSSCLCLCCVHSISRAAGLHGGLREEGGDGAREGGAHQEEEEEAQEGTAGCCSRLERRHIGGGVFARRRPCQDAVLVFGMLRLMTTIASIVL